MNSQSPIPRTDAAWAAYCIDPDCNNPWDFAEQLERELQEAIAYANRLVEHKSMACLPADLKNLREANAHFAVEIEELKKERHEARKLAVDYASDQLTKVTEQRDMLAEQIKSNSKATLMLERMVYKAREERDGWKEAAYSLAEAIPASWEELQPPAEQLRKYKEMVTLENAKTKEFLDNADKHSKMYP